MLIHLYIAFWRPDIRDELIRRGSPVAAMCDFIGNGESVVIDTRNVTCPACRETFLQALPTGDGTKHTWETYLASPLALPRVTMAQRAAEADKADAAWSTKPAPGLVNADLAAAEVKAAAVWSSLPPGPQRDMWATKAEPPSDWKTR